MNKLCCLIVMFFTCEVSVGQNLVPNGDFEQHSACPTSTNQLSLTLFWTNPAFYTPDYYHQCGSGNVQLPNAAFGYQYPHSDSAMAGIAVKNTSPNFREYIQTPLTSQLLSNQCYHFEMYVNLANGCEYGTNTIGAYFSDSALIGYPLSLNPQINNTSGFITDTLNWTLVSGNFTATGTENYLTIGNFKDDASTPLLLANSNPTVPFMYYYIDDVSLTTCVTGVNETIENTSIRISPNPFSGTLHITTESNDYSEVLLFEITSKKMLEQKFTNSVSLNTEQIAKGIYLYEVRNKNGVIKKGKVMKD